MVWCGCGMRARASLADHPCWVIEALCAVWPCKLCPPKLVAPSKLTAAVVVVALVAVS
jgi:hypothetical protein